MTRLIDLQGDGAAVSPTGIAVLWTESLHGGAGQSMPLEPVARFAGAVAAFVLRAPSDGATPRILSRHARSAPLQAVRPLGTDLIPVAVHRARVGTLWWLREADAGAIGARRLEQMRDCGIGEAVTLILAQGEGFVDLLELHLQRPPAGEEAGRLQELAQALSFAWRRVPDARLARRFALGPVRVVPSPQPVVASSPLSTGNPWRLTASELRICALIREGMTASDIVSATGAAESTVRSHLRSIYAKAGVSGQVALVRRLMEGASERPAARA